MQWLRVCGPCTHCPMPMDGHKLIKKIKYLLYYLSQLSEREKKLFDTFDCSNAFAFRVQVTHTLTRKNKMSNLIGLTFSTTMLLNWVLFYQDASRKDGFWAHRWFWTSPHRRYIGKAPWSRPGQTWAWSCPPPSTRSSSPPANTWSPATGHRVRHNQGRGVSMSHVVSRGLKTCCVIHFHFFWRYEQDCFTAICLNNVAICKCKFWI